MSAPLLSVIIPYFNGQRFFAQAIASIRAQGDVPLEILVVDDGSAEDDSAFIRAQDARIILHRQDNRGPAAARNTALRMAKGDIIGFLDADDMWPEGKLEAQLACLHGAQAPWLTSGRIRYVWEDGVRDAPLQLDGQDSLHHVHLGAVLARRRVFEAAGLFDETLRFSEDHDWWLRVREHHIPTVVLDAITLVYRRHTGNMTRDKSIRDVGLLHVLKQSLERRRQSGPARELPQFETLKETRRG